MAAPPPRAFTARWDDAPGLRVHLWKHDARALLPALALQLAAHFTLTGGVSLVALVAHASLLAAVSRAVHLGAGLAILPASRSTLAALQALRGSERLHKLTHGGLRAQLGPAAAMLERMRAVAPALRGSLLALPGAVRVALRTPDGAVLDGVYVPPAGAGGGGGGGSGGSSGGRGAAIAYAGGNGEHYEFRVDVAAGYSARGFGVLLFNYRGVGDSDGARAGGHCDRNGAVVDVATAAAFLTRGAGFDPRRVVLLGHSIGGAFVAEAARFVPAVLAVSDRSFGSLASVALFHVAAPAVEGALAGSAGGRAVRYAIRVGVCHLGAWELDAATHWRALPPSRKCVVWSAEDGVIPLPAQLVTAITAAVAAEEAGARAHRDEGGSAAGGGVSGEGSGGAAAGDGGAGTAAPDTLGDALGCVMRLLPLVGGRGGSGGGGGGGGDDAHNRPFTPDEERRLFGVVDRFLAGGKLPSEA